MCIIVATPVKVGIKSCRFGCSQASKLRIIASLLLVFLLFVPILINASSSYIPMPKVYWSAFTEACFLGLNRRFSTLMELLQYIATTATTSTTTTFIINDSHVQMYRQFVHK